jgi:hypothetical protein
MAFSTSGGRHVLRPEPEAPGRRHGGIVVHRWKLLGVLVIYAGLAVVWFHAIWFGHPSTEMQIGSDQINSVWALEWVPWAILHGHNPFYSTLQNYPFGVNLVTDTGVVLLGALLSPITLLFGPIAAFNVGQALAIFLSAASGYFFALRWVRTRLAAFLAGLLYGFSPYELAQSSGHLHLSFVALPPLILLALHHAATDQRRAPWKLGLILGVLVVLQFFVSSELLVDTVLIGTIAFLLCCVFDRRRVRNWIRHFAATVGWGMAVSAAGLAYPVWFALKGPAHIAGPLQLVPQGYRADLLASLVPDSRQLVTTPGLSHIANVFAANQVENGSYLGIPLLIFVTVGALILWRSTTVKVFSLTAGAAFILSLGSGLVVIQAPPGSVNSGFPLPGRILAELPLVKNAIPVRFSLFVDLFVAAVFAFTLETLYRWTQAGRSQAMRRGLLIAAAALCFLPLVPKPLSGVRDTGVPLLFTSSALQQIPRQSTAVIYPFPSANVPYAALWQAVSDMHFRQPGATFLVPGPDGRIAYSSELGYERSTLTARTLISIDNGVVPRESNTLRTALLSQLRSWSVRSFVAFPLGTGNANAAIGFFTWLFGREPSISPSSGAYEWFRLTT